MTATDELLNTLGLTPDDLQERVVERIAERVLGAPEDDDFGGRFLSDSEFRRQLDEQIQSAIDARVASLAEEHVLPHVHRYVEEITLQATNKWGEAKGEKLTFREYLVERAQAYMQEKVDWDGKSKEESKGYGWSGAQTRITYLVHRHLHHQIETSMKQALKTANDAIAEGIQEVVRMKLAEILKGIKATVSMPR